MTDSSLKITTIGDALTWAKSYLKSHSYDLSIDNASEFLLSELIGISKIALYAHFDDRLDDEKIKTFVRFIKRAANNEPLQYILGYAYFDNHKFSVGKGVLIPRPETEYMVFEVLKLLKNNTSDSIKILDLCTGSACIACTLAKKIPNSKIWATDISKEAIQFAKLNIKNLKVEDQIILKNCNLADDVCEDNFDLIISNPPYVPSKVMKTLPNNVKNFEPKLALEAGDEGLDFLPEILSIAKNKLKNSGILAIELFEDSLNLAKEFIEKNSNFKAQDYKDYSSKNRFIIAKKKAH